MSQASFHFSFYGLCAILAWLAGRGILGGQTIFAYPTLSAMMGLAWVVPQGIELESNPANPYSSEAFWLYVTACFVCIALGFRHGFKKQRRRMAHVRNELHQRFSHRRLLIAAAGLTALGQFAAFQMQGIDTSRMEQQWTGVITMWALLTKASGFGLCLAVLVYARTRWWVALAIAAVAVVPLVQAAFLWVRREALFDLMILTVGAWYVAKRSYPPRAAVILAALIGTVVLNTAGDLRGRVIVGKESLVEILTSEDTYESFNYTSLGQGETSEVGLAQYDFWYMNQNSHWELGAEYWNSLVHQYVPAFMLGREFKESLKLSTLSRRIGLREEKGEFSHGSTRTGFSDSYRSFGPFGCLIFYIMSYYFGTMFYKLNQNYIDGQYINLVILAEGLKGITHSTGEFLASLPFVLLIYWISFEIAKIPTRYERK